VTARGDRANRAGNRAPARCAPLGSGNRAVPSGRARPPAQPDRRGAVRAPRPRTPRGGWLASAAARVTGGGPHPPSVAGCHVIWREGPQPLPAMSTPTPAAVRAPAGRPRAGPTVIKAVALPALDPTHASGVPLAVPGSGSPLVMPLVGPVGRRNRGRLAPLGGMERPRRKERFARWSIGAAAFLADLRPAPPSRPGCATPPCRCDAA
jgi:hypothetical protein